MPDDSKRQSDTIVTRRDLIHYWAAIGMGGVLAGCGTGGQGDQGASPTDTPQGTATDTPAGTPMDLPGGGRNIPLGEAVDPTLNYIETTAPGEVQYSPIGRRGAFIEYQYPMVQPFGIDPQWSADTDPYWKNYVPALCQKSRYNPETGVWRIEYNEGFKFEDGDPVTIDDLIARRMIDQIRKNKGWADTPWKEIRKIDDYTAEFVHEEEERAPRGLFYAAREPSPRRKKETLQPFLEGLRDATSKSEAQSVLDSAEQSKNLIDIDEFIGWGPWKVDEVRDTEVIYTKNEHHPYSKVQNIEEVHALFKASEAARRLAWQNGQADVSWAASPPKGTTLPRGYSKQKKRGFEGAKVYLNRNNKHLDRIGVRRAIAYAVDHRGIAQNTGVDITLSPPPGQNGMMKLVAQAWIDDFENWRDKIIQYGLGPKVEAAKESLRNEGYEQNSDGKWIDGEGDELKLIYRGNWWPNMANTLTSNLRRVGFTIDLRYNDKWLDVFLTGDKTGAWDIIDADHGPDETNFGPYCFAADRWNGLLVKGGRGPFIGDQPKTKHFAGHPWEYTIPKEVGAKKVTGDGRSFDLIKLKDEVMAPETSAKRRREITKLLAEWWNFEIPAVYIGDSIWTSTFNFNDYVWADANNDGVALEGADALRLALSHGKEK